MGTSEEHGTVSGGRSEAVASRSTAVLCGLRAGGRRTGAVGSHTVSYAARQSYLIALSWYPPQRWERSRPA
jgi:hypothetical protein